MKPPEIQNDLEFDTIILSSIDIPISSNSYSEISSSIGSGRPVLKGRQEQK